MKSTTKSNEKKPIELIQSNEQIECLRQRNLYLQNEWDAFSKSHIGNLYKLYKTVKSKFENILFTSIRLVNVVRANGFKGAVRLIFKIQKLKQAHEDIAISSKKHEIIDDHETIQKNKIRKLKITWIVFGHLPKGGGHRNIYRMAYHLEKFGHDVTIHITDTNFGSTHLSDHIKSDIYPIAGDIISYNGIVDSCDVLIATHWESIKYIDKHVNSAKSVCYFVQDYEPLFYPMGSRYLLAQETYKRGYLHICSGEWVYRKISKSHGSVGGFFNFPIDSKIYFDKKSQRKKNSIAFFAKPEMDRRCFEIGIYALERLNLIRNDFEVTLYGSSYIKDYKLNFPHRIISFAKSLDDLAQLYNECEIGIAFSTTNPSLVPYEMMSCGLIVVDLYTELSEYNYGGTCDAALLCQPNPVNIAEKISSLMDSQQQKIMRKTEGLKLTSKFPSEKEAAKVVEKLIYKSLE